MNSEEIFAQWVKDLPRGIRYITQSIGIIVNLSNIPEHVAYRELEWRLGRMTCFRRWLSFKLRRELTWRRLVAREAVLDCILETNRAKSTEEKER